MENHKNSYNTPYKFNGKEQDSETGYYYYGARYYNPRVSLWLNVDPLAEKHPDYSPYVYCANNSVRFIDPDGRDWYENNKTHDIMWKDSTKNIKGFTHLGKKWSIGQSVLDPSSYGKSRIERMYFFHVNGSITVKTGDAKYTLDHIEDGKSVKSIFGPTYTSSATSVSGLAVQGSYTQKVLGSLSATVSFGYVADSYTGGLNGKFYYSYGWGLSNSSGPSLEFTTIKSTNPNKLFDLKRDFKGFGSSLNLSYGSGFTWGGSSDTNNFKFNSNDLPGQWGQYDGGYTTFGFSFGPKPAFGASFLKTYTDFVKNENKKKK